MTSRRWIKPPRVYEDTRPRSHNTNKITKIVQSIGVSFCRRVQAGSRADADVSQVCNNRVGEQDRQCKFFHDFHQTCCFVVGAGTAGGLNLALKSQKIVLDYHFINLIFVY
jgi:hypothetical protein